MRIREVAMCGMAVAIPSCVLLAGCSFQGDDVAARAAHCRHGPLLSSSCHGQCTMRLRGGSSGVQGRDGTGRGSDLTGVHDAWQPAAQHSMLQEARGETSNGAKAVSAHHKEDAGMQDDTGDEHHTKGGGGSAAEGRRAEDFWTGSVRRPWGQAGENTKMGNDEAVRRFQSGACVLVLDFPVEMDFGIDVRSWTVGPKFKGLKMVPAGIHLLYWDAGHGMTQGMWFHARPSQVLIMRWDESIEDFAPTESPGLPAEQLERLVAAVRRYEFDSGLAAYPMEDLQTWRDLTHFLDRDVLAAAGLPIGAHGTSCHVVSGDPDENAKADNTTTHMTAYFPGPARTARFSCISTVRKAALRAFRHKQNDPSANATQCSILEGDETDTLKMLLHTGMQGLPARLLGEVQLAFVCFLLLHSNSAFEYWKLAVSAFCSARRLAVERPGMMHNVVSCMHVELARAPSDWFRDELTQDNFLRTALLNLYLLCSDLREALAREATSATQPASPRRETALCFKSAISAGKGRLLVRKIGALFEFVEEHFSIRVAEWAEGRRSLGTRSQTQFGAGFKSGLARAFGRKQPSEDMCDDIKAGHGSDDVADNDGGLRVERIPVKRHVRGIDDEAKLLCDDDEVGGEEDDEGPYVEYMTRELPLHRTSVCPGEGDGGGGVSESDEEAGMQDVEGEMELEAETEGPLAMHDQEDKLEDFSMAEGEQAHLLDRGEQRQEEGVDTTRQLEVALSLIPSLRQTLDQYCSNASNVPDSNPPPSEGEAPRQGVAGGFSRREDGEAGGGGGGGGREARVRQRQVSLPPDLLTNPESVVDGKDGMVIDLRRSNETKLLVAGQEPDPNMVLQLQEYFQRPVSMTRVTASGGENAARDRDGACHDGARVGQGTTRLEGAIPAGAGFGDDKMDGMRREESGPAVAGEGGGCSERGHAVHGASQLAGCRGTSCEAEEAEEAGSIKRQWGPLDYSRFNSLDVSDEPERRPYDMCTQCRGPRPAELEIRDENETLLDYVCKQCYIKPRRMEWMLDPPEGWVDPLAPSEDGSQPPDQP